MGCRLCDALIFWSPLVLSTNTLLCRFAYFLNSDISGDSTFCGLIWTTSPKLFHSIKWQFQQRQSTWNLAKTSVSTMDWMYKHRTLIYFWAKREDENQHKFENAITSHWQTETHKEQIHSTTHHNHDAKRNWNSNNSKHIVCIRISLEFGLESVRLILGLIHWHCIGSSSDGYNMGFRLFIDVFHKRNAGKHQVQHYIKVMKGGWPLIRRCYRWRRILNSNLIRRTFSRIWSCILLHRGRPIVLIPIQ